MKTDRFEKVMLVVCGVLDMPFTLGHCQIELLNLYNCSI